VLRFPPVNLLRFLDLGRFYSRPTLGKLIPFDLDREGFLLRHPETILSQQHWKIFPVLKKELPMLTDSDIHDLQSQFRQIRNPNIKTVTADFTEALKHLTKFRAMWIAVQDGGDDPTEHDRYPKLWNEFGDGLAHLLAVDLAINALGLDGGEFEELRRHYRGLAVLLGKIGWSTNVVNIDHALQYLKECVSISKRLSNIERK
jgi:hypothetical protein